MKLIVDVRHDNSGVVSVEVDLVDNDPGENGAVDVKSVELAMCELLKDIALGLVDEATRGFWQDKVCILDEFDAYHQNVIDRMKRGDFGENVRKFGGAE